MTAVDVKALVAKYIAEKPYAVDTVEMAGLVVWAYFVEGKNVDLGDVLRDIESA